MSASLGWDTLEPSQSPEVIGSDIIVVHAEIESSLGTRATTRGGCLGLRRLIDLPIGCDNSRGRSSYARCSSWAPLLPQMLAGVEHLSPGGEDLVPLQQVRNIGGY